MEDKTRECLAKSTAILNDTVSASIEYSAASMEYSGLVIYSFIKRGGVLFLQPVVKVTLPLWEKAGNLNGIVYRKALEGLKKSLKSVKSLKKFFTIEGEKLESIEQRLIDMEGRLAYLERHGVMATKEGLQVKGKKLTDEKMMFLRTIVSENIELRVEE
ncbi:MAG: hypothetical protein HQK94_09070 [Nitrospirae bacterium]|nr:hypothetical protein [Nitrospirota bacterium]